MRAMRLVTHFTFALCLLAAPGVQAQPGAVLNQDLAHPQGTNAGIFAFTARCAGCHDTRKNGATDRYALALTRRKTCSRRSPPARWRATRRAHEYEKRVVAVYVGGRPLGAARSGDAAQMKNRCQGAPRVRCPPHGSAWNGWGVDAGNSRFQTSPGLTAADTPRLALKWAFGFPNGNSAYGQPTVVGGRVFVGADTGFVYSLERVERLHPLVVPGERRRADGDQHRTGQRRASMPRLLRRREGQRVRRRRADRGAGVAGTGRYPSSRARHGRADAGRRAAVRAALVARGIRRRQSQLSLLHVPRRPRRLRRRQREAGVEVLHDPAGTDFR